MEPGKTEELIFHPSSRDEEASVVRSCATATIFFFCAKYIFSCEILTIKRDALLWEGHRKNQT